jgi:ABC-type multidrug transport system permease subunit
MLSFSVLFPLFMLGGSLFPSEAMPAWMAAIGRWTPNGWAVEQLKAILIGRTAPTPHGLAFLVVTIVASLLLIVTAARVRRVFVRS